MTKFSYMSEPASPLIAMNKLNRGEMGRIEDPGYPRNFGKTVLAIYDGFVCLDDPSTCWTGACTIKVLKLPAGTVVTLTQE
jgi:hypothetical protein